MRKPARHRFTVGRVTPTGTAISELRIPSEARSAIRARRARPARTDEDRGQPDKLITILKSKKQGRGSRKRRIHDPTQKRVVTSSPRQ